MKNRTYDWLKRYALYVAPATVTALLAVYQEYGLSWASTGAFLVGISATWIGSVIGVSSRSYHQTPTTEGRHMQDNTQQEEDRDV